MARGGGSDQGRGRGERGGGGMMQVAGGVWRGVRRGGGMMQVGNHLVDINQIIPCLPWFASHLRFIKSCKGDGGRVGRGRGEEVIRGMKQDIWGYRRACKKWNNSSAS